MLIFNDILFWKKEHVLNGSNLEIKCKMTLSPLQFKGSEIEQMIECWLNCNDCTCFILDWFYKNRKSWIIALNLIFQTRTKQKGLWLQLTVDIRWSPEKYSAMLRLSLRTSSLRKKTDEDVLITLWKFLKFKMNYTVVNRNSHHLKIRIDSICFFFKLIGFN